jgi:hypothetical protein
MTRRRHPQITTIDLPPKTPEEIASSGRFAEAFNRIADELRAQNLANAVALAQQAACGYGPLVDHFTELGRRYSHLLTERPAKDRSRLRIVSEGSV